MTKQLTAMTREQLADELAAAGEYTGDWRYADIDDLRERVALIGGGRSYTRCAKCGLEVDCQGPDAEHATGPCPRCDCTLRVRHSR